MLITAPHMTLNFKMTVAKVSLQKVHWKKHIYVHKELRFVCDRCGMGFPFESWLSQHKITHHTYASLKCMKKNCDKCFKNVGDLNQHVKQHKHGVWFYCDFCDYKNKDKRNTDSHQRIHIVGDEKYSCHI